VLLALPGLAMGPRTLFAGDRPMQTVTPRRVFESAQLIDVAAVAVEGRPYLISLEHQGPWSRPAPEQPPLEPGLTRIWAETAGGGPPHELAHGPAHCPYGSAAAIAVRGGRILALMEVNVAAPAWLLSAPPPAPPTAPPFGPETPVLIDAEWAPRIVLNGLDAWSSNDLQPESWLFHPSLSAGGPGGAVLLAMNAADGHALVWSWTQGHLHPLAILPAALDPAPVSVGGRTLVVYRAMAHGWRIFFDDPRREPSRTPVAMPLMLAELAAGAVHPIADLSSQPDVGRAFAFGACADGEGLAIAAAIDVAGRACLRVFTVSALGKVETLLADSPLPGAPIRVSLARTEGSRLVALVYRLGDVFTVEAISLPTPGP
jgi:hypothetical protein